jgi:hypothetical protein
LDISVRYPSKPLKVTLQPGNKLLKYKYDQGKILCKIDKLKIYDIIVVE